MPSSGSSRRRAIVEIALYGVAGGLLIALLRWVEYRYLVVEHSFQVYAGLIAVLFAAVGLWLGRSLAGARGPRPATASVPPPTAAVVAPPTTSSEPFRPDASRLEHLGITARELEVLGLIALGLSNREIADRLFVSENTVKTHARRLFDKLGARRRTEAVQIGQRNRLIPAAGPSGHPPEG